MVNENWKKEMAEKIEKLVVANAKNWLKLLMCVIVPVTKSEKKLVKSVWTVIEVERGQEVNLYIYDVIKIQVTLRQNSKHIN